MNDTANGHSLQGLRQWAKGLYPLEAAVELLVRAFGGRFARVGYPWVAQSSGADGYWLDVEQLTPENTAVYSGGERRLLALVASLAGGGTVNLYEEIPGLDRHLTALFLAAVAHASGSHEHGRIEIDSERGGAISCGRQPSLYPWPQELRCERTRLP